MMILFIIALVCFAYTAVTIYRYLTSSFRLLENVQSSAPETWESLGRPEKVWIQNVKPGQAGGMYTIQPLWPWLNWVWLADDNGLDYRLGKELKQVSRLLKQGVAGFGITMLAFIYVIVISPPA